MIKDANILSLLISIFGFIPIIVYIEWKILRWARKRDTIKEVKKAEARGEITPRQKDAMIWAVEKAYND